MIRIEWSFPHLPHLVFVAQHGNALFPDGVTNGFPNRPANFLRYQVGRLEPACRGKNQAIKLHYSQPCVFLYCFKNVHIKGNAWFKHVFNVYLFQLLVIASSIPPCILIGPQMGDQMLLEVVLEGQQEVVFPLVLKNILKIVIILCTT